MFNFTTSIHTLFWFIVAFSQLSEAADLDSALGANYNDRYGQQIAGTLNIHWELISGPVGSPVGCTAIELTDGTLADAFDGGITMSGLAVSIDSCIGLDNYTFTMANDGLSLTGFASTVPMTLTRLPEESAFVGDWADSGYVYRAHVAADPFPVPDFNPQFEGEWIGWFERSPSLEMGTVRMLVNNAFFNGVEWSFDGLLEWDCLFNEECSASENVVGTVTAAGLIHITGSVLTSPINWTLGTYDGQLSDNRRTITGTIAGGTWSVTRVSAFVVPTEVATIQNVVDTFAERPGLRIEIEPGTYAENLNLSALATNPSAVDITGLGSADQVVIDDGLETLGDSIIQTLGAGSQYPLHLRNLTVSGGYVEALSSDQGGAGLRVNGGTRHLVIESCVLRDNHLINRSTSGNAIGAGAVLFSGTRVRFDSCVFDKNISSGGAPIGAYVFRGIGGGIGASSAIVHIVSSGFTENEAYGGGGIASYGSALRIVDSEFIDNNPDGTGALGGGILLGSNNELDLIRSTFRGNQVWEIDNNTGVGGGISSVVSNIRLIDAIFESNTAQNSGAGLRVDGGSTHITGGRFGGPNGLGNIALNEDPYELASGGAITNSGAASFIINGTHFEGNSSESSGGAIFFSSPCFNACNMRIEGSTFLANQANKGGAIYSSYREGSMTVIDSDFEENFATEVGGAFYQSWYGGGTNSTAVINNSRFFRNNTLGTSGAAIGIDYGPYLFEIIGSSIVDNSAEGVDALGAGVAIFNGTLDISNSILWANTGTAGSVEVQQIARAESATILAQNGIVEGYDSFVSTLGPGTLSGEDPKFVDVSSGDLHLLLGSSAIDAGDVMFTPVYQTYDLDGNNRINGVEVDFGPYENPYIDVIFKNDFESIVPD